LKNYINGNNIFIMGFLERVEEEEAEIIFEEIISKNLVYLVKNINLHRRIVESIIYKRCNNMVKNTLY
jgi:hypothetical protein